MRNMITYYKICKIVREIRNIKKSFSTFWYDLEYRNVTFHNGKLNMDSLMNEYQKEKNSEIFSLKREIVKLKNSVQ